MCVHKRDPMLIFLACCCCFGLFLRCISIEVTVMGIAELTDGNHLSKSSQHNFGRFP